MIITTLYLQLTYVRLCGISMSVEQYMLKESLKESMELLNVIPDMI